MKPVNVAAVTEAIVGRLADDPRTSAVTISRSDYVNDGSSACPWIGVYRTGVQYPIRLLGTPAGFRGTIISLLLVVQQSSVQSGEDCEIALEALIRDVISVLFDDPTFNGTVDTIDAFNVRYPDFSLKDGEYMQTAFIEFDALTKTGY